MDTTKGQQASEPKPIALYAIWMDSPHNGKCFAVEKPGRWSENPEQSVTAMYLTLHTLNRWKPYFMRLSMHILNIARSHSDTHYHLSKIGQELNSGVANQFSIADWLAHLRIDRKSTRLN